METAPAALRIFDTFGKTTFATLSREERKSNFRYLRSLLTQNGFPHSLPAYRLLGSLVSAATESLAIATTKGILI
jgi:hypothetical protein